MESAEHQLHNREMQILHPIDIQGRLLSQVREVVPSNASRLTTDAEEEWLTSQDQISEAQNHWLQKQSENMGRQAEVVALKSDGARSIRDHDSGDEKEAEEFDRDSELLGWTRAQEQKLVLVEAEELSAFEQEHVLDDARCYHNHEETVRRSNMCEVLQTGSLFLIRDDCLANAGYEELVSVRYAAHQLLEVVDREMQSFIEREREVARQHLEAAWEFNRNAEIAAHNDQRCLEEEIFKLKQSRGDLLELLELERDRNICRICFARPRDVLSLPCMHFDYCHQCLEEEQKTRNHCPTCRSPISGTLVCRLNMG